MPAFIKIDGVDGEVQTAHSEANWEMTLKVLDAGTLSGAMTNVELAITVTDTETGNSAPGAGNESTLIYSGESGGLADDRPMTWDVLKQSPLNGTAEAGGHAKWIETESWTWGDAGSASHGAGGGGGAGKVSVHDISLRASAPKGAADEIAYGLEGLASAGADASALGNTYLGVTTIDQGVLQAEHSTMMLSFAYYMA